MTMAEGNEFEAKRQLENVAVIMESPVRMIKNLSRFIFLIFFLGRFDLDRFEFNQG